MQQMYFQIVAGRARFAAKNIPRIIARDRTRP
jgi:hypothetical protein